MTESGCDGQEQVAGRTSAQRTRHFGKSDNARSWSMHSSTVMAGRSAFPPTSLKQKPIVFVGRHETEFACKLSLTATLVNRT